MEINFDQERKIIKVSLIGIPTYESTQSIFKSYGEIVDGLDAESYSLLIDCRQLSIFDEKSIPVLKKLYKGYIKSGFKNIVFIKSPNEANNLQLEEIGKSLEGFYGVFTDDKEEAIKLCSK